MNGGNQMNEHAESKICSVEKQRADRLFEQLISKSLRKEQKWEQSINEIVMCRKKKKTWKSILLVLNSAYQLGIDTTDKFAVEAKARKLARQVNELVKRKTKKTTKINKGDNNV